jgi:RND family efflux transporter MFP subunit
VPHYPIFKTVYVSLLLCLCLSLFACSESDTAVKASSEIVLKPVRTLTISLGHKMSRSFPGVVDASQSAEIGFRVAGELKEVNVKEGQSVIKGQVLAMLDQTDYKISLQATQSDYMKSKSDFDRAKQLIKKGAISRSDYDKLSAQLTASKAKLESAEQNLKYTVLKAPFDGVVAKTYLSNFEKVSGTEKFAAIQDLSAFEVAIDIPESIMIKVKRGNHERQVYATFSGAEGQQYPLIFKEVSTRADEKNQTYRVRFVMDSPADINVLPGMSTTVFAIEKEDEQRSQDVYVPAHAVLEDSAGRFVYVFKSSADTVGGFVERRSVVVGRLNENGIQVVKGLIVGDKVITAGVSKIANGMNVRLMDGE